MEDLVLWPRRLSDLQEMEAGGGLMAQMDPILLEEQADGDRQDTLEDRLGSLRACQVVGHLHRVRQVSQEDHQEDQDGLRMDRPTDLQTDRQMDLRTDRRMAPVVDHRDLHMDHLVAVVDHQEDLLATMDREEMQEIMTRTVALRQLWKPLRGAPSNKQN